MGASKRGWYKQRYKFRYLLKNEMGIMIYPSRRKFLACTGAALLSAGWSIGGSLKSLNAFVGDTVASLNMLPWYSNNQATDFLNNYTFSGSAADNTTVIGPNGGAIATHLAEDASFGTHYTYSFNFPQCRSCPPIPYRVAAIAKAGERTRIVIAWEIRGRETTATGSVGFDLVGGNVGYDIAHGTEVTVSNSTIVALVDGYYLCYFDAVYSGPDLSGATIIIQPKLYIDNGSGTAARSISYAGNGTSGVNLLWFNMLPAVVWGINRTVFFDDFLSIDTIDLANTLDPSKNWFLRNYAPNSANQLWWGSSILPPSYAGAFTISSPSVLKMFDPRANAPQWSTLMYSVGFPDAGGYVGNAWRPPMVMESSMAWDYVADLTPYHGMGMAFWGMQVEAMTGATSHWTEWDIIDGAARLVGPDDEIYSAGAVTVNPFSQGISGSYASSFNASVFRTVSGLWIDVGTTGNWGLYMSFLDGQMIASGDTAYSVTVQQPNSGVSGALYAGDTYHQPIMFDTGSSSSAIPGGYPLYVDWARVKTT